MAHIKPVRLHLVRPPIRLVIGATEHRYLLDGRTIGFHVDGQEIRIELEKAERLDPPEARELVSTFRRRPR
jgi:hypothetical protein